MLYSQITNEFPEGSDRYFTAGSKVIFDFSGSPFEYIDLNSIIHTFNMDFGDTLNEPVDKAERVQINYLGKNAIIDNMKITDMRGNTILNYDYYYLLYPFVDFALIKKKNDTNQFINRYDIFRELQDTLQQTSIPFFDKMLFAIADKNKDGINDSFYINKNFKLEIFLGDKCYSSGKVLEDIVPYKYLNAKMYFKGTNSKPQQQEVRIPSLRYKSLKNQKTRDTVSFKYDRNTDFNFFFIHNTDDMYTYNRGFGQPYNTDSQFRKYFNPETGINDLSIIERYNTLQNNVQYAPAYIDTADADSQYTNEYYKRMYTYILPEYLRFESEGYKMDYGTMYLYGRDNNHIMHTVNLIEKMERYFGVDLIENENRTSLVRTGGSFGKLCHIHFFSMVEGQKNYIDVTISRPIVVATNTISDSEFDILCNVSLTKQSF
jgi:hypothetical protein